VRIGICTNPPGANELDSWVCGPVVFGRFIIAVIIENAEIGNGRVSHHQTHQHRSFFLYATFYDIPRWRCFSRIHQPQRRSADGTGNDRIQWNDTWMPTWAGEVCVVVRFHPGDSCG
jgi:hypothetical protein